MTVEELITLLPLTVVSGQSKLGNEITGGYISDLLSNVMGQACAGNVWVTMQGHQNIVAVASLTGLAAVIIAGGVKLDKDAASKAEAEEIVVLGTPLSSFEVTGRLYQLGIAGK